MNTDPTSSDRRRSAQRLRDHVTPSIPGYHVLERLSSSALSSTYRAIQLSMQREVALQVLLPRMAKIPGFAERFMQEARSAGAVHHPHVVACYDVGQSDGIIFQALELINGLSLPQFFTENAIANGAQSAFLTPAHAISLVVDATRGLEGIHRAGLIHGDLRLSNIFVTNDEVVKLAGFAMSRSIEAIRESDPDAQTAAERGTLAPEQFVAGGRIDIRSDLYALGAALYYLLTGKQPFSGQNERDLAQGVRHASIPDPRDVQKDLNVDLVSVIAKALAKDPAERYATPGQLREDLERVQYDFVPIHALPLTIGKVERAIIDRHVPERLTAGQLHADAIHSPTNTIDKGEKFLLIPRAEETKRDWRLLAWGALGISGMAAFFWYNHLPSVVAVSNPALPVPAVVQASEKTVRDPAIPSWSSAGGTDHHGRWLELNVRGVPLRLRPIPAGRFVMGSLATDPAYRPDEQAVEVTLSHAFWMGESEVTQAQYFALTGARPSGFHGDQLPVENITWQESLAFTKRLNAFLPGLQARLPTEAEWEYACRAGNDDLASRSPSGWFSGPTILSTQAVMGLPANAWGLHDMQGNVMEWCQDTYGPYPTQPSTNPLKLDGISRVVRGGSWVVDRSEGRPATRGKYIPVAHHAHVGFRIVVENY